MFIILHTTPFYYPTYINPAFIKKMDETECGSRISIVDCKSLEVTETPFEIIRLIDESYEGETY